MSLTAADVAEIMRLLEQSSFDELTLEMAGIKLSLRRGVAVAPPVSAPASGVAGSGASAASSAPAVSVAGGAAAVASVAPAAAAPPAPADPDLQDVTAPLLGTFYRSPKPGAPPFVEVGAAVEEDTIVAIIEVMKLMNTVRAGVRGKVTEILTRDGVLVEYGETLLRVRKPG